MADAQRDTDNDKVTEQRWELLARIDALIDRPLVVLAFAWLVLLIVDLTMGLNRSLEIATFVLWGLFVLDFVLEFVIAPRKGEYLRRNWLVAIALILPAVRVLAVLRVLRGLQGLRVVRSVVVLRVVTSLNRGMAAVSAVLGHRGIGFVIALSVLVMFAGAAGIQLLESPAALRAAGYSQQSSTGTTIHSFGDALWWTAMMLTTMGTDYWPKTTAGRILAWLLALYAFAIFGYITAAVASFLIGWQRDAAGRQDPSANATDAEALTALRQEVTALRGEVAALTERSQSGSGQEGHSPTRNDEKEHDGG